MTDTKRLPTLIVRGIHKGPMISLATRLLIVAAIVVSVSVVVAILLVQRFGATWDVVPAIALTIIAPATIAAAVNYLYWRPRYRVL